MYTEYRLSPERLTGEFGTVAALSAMVQLSKGLVYLLLLFVAFTYEVVNKNRVVQPGLLAIWWT